MDPVTRYVKTKGPRWFAVACFAYPATSIFALASERYVLAFFLIAIPSVALGLVSLLVLLYWLFWPEEAN